MVFVYLYYGSESNKGYMYEEQGEGGEGGGALRKFRLSFVFLHNVLLVLGNEFFSICNITD